MEIFTNEFDWSELFSGTFFYLSFHGSSVVKSLLKMNPEKLAQLQSQVRIGGKGTPRRKVKKVTKSSNSDDKKLTATLKKLNVQQVGGIEEVNMFRNDGKIIHFVAPKGTIHHCHLTWADSHVPSRLVQASIASNTFVISGEPQVKDLTELVPGILTQMGQDSLAQLRQLAEQFKAQAGASGNDDDVPDLVETETFDQA